MDSGLKDQVVVVTGASGGIGGEIVNCLIAENAKVAVHFHRGVERANNIVAQLVDSGKTAIAVGADLTDEQQVATMFARVNKELGPPHVCIANAGVWPKEAISISEMSLDRWNSTIAANMTSVFLCAREFLKLAHANQIEDPAIVVTGSTAGFFGEAGHADYAAAKGGLMFGLLQSLKNEITRRSPRGRINAVCPGWTSTPMTDRFTDNEAAVTKALQTIPLRKIGKAKDVASAVTFLASNLLAGHISGQTLFVSGGMEGRVINEPDEIDLAQAIS